MKVVYKGDHAAVVVPVTATSTIAANWGEPVEMPDAVAESLLESEAWIKASKETSKKSAAADEAVEAADTNDEGKE